MRYIKQLVIVTAAIILWLISHDCYVWLHIWCNMFTLLLYAQDLLECTNNLLEYAKDIFRYSFPTRIYRYHVWLFFVTWNIKTFCKISNIHIKMMDFYFWSFYFSKHSCGSPIALATFYVMYIWYLCYITVCIYMYMLYHSY